MFSINLRGRTMLTRTKALGAGLLLALAHSAHADDTTYQGLGGKAGIKNIVDTFIPLLLADVRVKDSLADFDMAQLNARLQEQFCELSGGPCRYTGKYRDKGVDGAVRDMRSVHQDLNISNAQFNALTEDLQRAMEQNAVPNRVANRLIAQLAPMQRDIVTATQAQSAPDLGKFLATGGVSQLEGAGGGGITPWALITGYGTRDSWGANVHATHVGTQDYTLASYGVAVGLADRLELSLARQDFRGSKAPLDRLRIQQDILGLKVKVAGDAVYAQDQWMPQLAVGVLYKRNQGVGGLGALGVTNVKQLGARDDHGYDYYVAATKILFEQSLLLNGTLRATRANQMGLLGFGGDHGDSLRLMPELSAAYLLDRQLAVGVEYRRKPHNLGLDPEKAYYDAFVAWFPSKVFSLTAAYAALGDITVFNPTRQRGLYLSLQAGF
jgi:truncated hemoglobin YjbI